MSGMKTRKTIITASEAIITITRMRTNYYEEKQPFATFPGVFR
jgi:hypothetical protein